MNTLRELRLAAGLSQEKLAEMAGTSQPQINKLETGQRKMTVDWAVRLAKPLGADPSSLLDVNILIAPHHGSSSAYSQSDERGIFRVSRSGAKQYLAEGSHPDHRSMPVRAAARGGVDQEMFLEDGPIDWVAKPEYLKNARDPYGMYVVGDSMMPRFRPAQLLHINPHKPPAPGSGVVLVKKSKAVLVKEFVRRTAEGDVVLREYQPQDREFTVPLDEVDVLHTVVGLQEP